MTDESPAGRGRAAGTTPKRLAGQQGGHANATSRAPLGPSRIALLASLPLLLPCAARAGGFDIPDLGAEALGRGGAFVAKADSPLALYYNIAGLARQRGTRLLLDGGVIYHNDALTVSGAYPGDPMDQRTPYAQQPYPKMHDGSNWSPLPVIGVTTDFGFFKTLTFGLAVYPPPAVGMHTYGTRVDKATNDPAHPTIAYETTLPSGMSAPAPTRYDVAATNLLILLPTFGVAWQPVKFLSIGAAAQLVYASFDLSNANYTPLGPKICPTPDYQGCDSYAQLKTSGVTGTGVFSVMFHPTDWLDLGATYRMEANIHTEGKPAPGASDGAAGLHPYSPPVHSFPLLDSPVTFDTKLPHWVRLGIRGVGRYPDGTEQFDIELDLTWEHWSALQADKIHADDFTLGMAGGQLDAEVPHHYKDTAGVRLGGAYNHRLSERSRFIARLGFYYDSAATESQDTHLDFNTADKFGFTAGLGYKYRGFTVNLGYAFIYSPPRDVSDGRLRALNSFNGSAHTRPDDPNDLTSDAACGASTATILCHYNNGRYEFATQLLALGVTFNFSEFKSAALMRN